MAVNRRLIEAQVEFAIFPEATLVTEGQDSVVQDAVAHRVQLANLDEGRRRPKGPRAAKRVMQALAASLKAMPSSTGGTLWQRACDAIANNEVEGAVFDLSAAQAAALRGTYDKQGCAEVDFLVALEINGKSNEFKATTLYSYFHGSRQALTT